MKYFILFAFIAVALARHHGERKNQLRATDPDVGEKIKQAYAAAFTEVHEKFFKDSGCTLGDWEAIHHAKKAFGKKLHDLGCDGENEADFESMVPKAKKEGKKMAPKRKQFLAKAFATFKNETNLTLSDSCDLKAVVGSVKTWHRNAKQIGQIFKNKLQPYEKEIKYFHDTVKSGMESGALAVKDQFFSESKCSRRDFGKIVHFFKKTIMHIALEKGIDAVSKIQEPTPEQEKKITAYVRHWRRHHRVSCDVEDIKTVMTTMFLHANDIKKVFKAHVIAALKEANIPVPEKEMEDSCEDDEDDDDEDEDERDFFEEKSFDKFDLYREISKREKIENMNNLFQL